MINDIKAQIKRIDTQIAAENEVYKVWKRYTDSDIKTAVIHQQIGVVRGLEVAKESLAYLLHTADDMQITMDFETDPANLEKMGKAVAAETRMEKRKGTETYTEGKGWVEME